MKTIYKKIIISNDSSAAPLLGASESTGYIKSSTLRIPNILAIPALALGVLAGAVVFSALFAVLLIPMGIFGFKAWRRFSKLRQQASENSSLNAEYTVIRDADKQRD